MANTWDKIPQTHRTILFEQFSDITDASANDLYNFLLSYDDEDLNSKIREKLEVKSFEEFLQKFPLTIYEYVVGSDDGSAPKIHYTTDTRKAAKFPQRREIKLTDHSYFEMLLEMYSKKGTSGQANIEFNDAKVREILTPKRELEKLYNMRRQIPLLYERKEELLKKNENPGAIDRKIKEIRRDALEHLQRPTSLISLALADTNQKIEMVNDGIKMLSAPADGVENENTKLLGGSVGFNDDGKLILIPAKTSDVNSDESTDSETNSQGRYLKLMAGRMEKDVDKYSADANNFTKALVISAYTGVDIMSTNSISGIPSNRAELELYRGELTSKKNTYEQIFRQIEDEFVKTLSELVQKVLCVKIFFDHATISGTLPNVGLIVTNCKAEKLLESSVKDKFIDLMKRLGKSSTDKNKLWFAVLPQVEEDEFSLIDDDEDDEEDLFGENNSNENKKSVSRTDFATAKELLKILGECTILTFFNFVPQEETTFSNITARKINDLKDKLSAINSEHAVYALPNFTIMKSGTVPISDAEKISVPAVYIDASYVAAGLLIASQQIDFWASRGFKNEITMLNSDACVRINLESSDAVRALLTKFNRERSLDWAQEVTDAFIKDRFGFTFEGKRVFDHHGNKFIDNTYILNARTLKKVDGEYQPIYMTLTRDFVETYWNTYQSTSESVKDFIDNVVADWKRQSTKKYADKKIINFMLKDGETIDYDKDDKKFKISLKSGEKFLDISFDVEVKE